MRLGKIKKRRRTIIVSILLRGFKAQLNKNRQSLADIFDPNQFQSR